MTEIRLTRRNEYVPRRFSPVTRGVSTLRTADDLVRLGAWQAALPEEAAFTHLTAARIRGWWLPATPSAMPVFVVAPADRRVRRRGARVAQATEPYEVEEVDGLRVTAVADTLGACARDLEDLDLLMLVDAARAARSAPPVVRPGARGSVRLRRVLARSAVAESAWEVVLRELHRCAGAAVRPQHVVTSPAGEFVARGDLWLEGTRVLHEYDGGHHRTPEQLRADLRRDRRLLTNGWVRRAYTRRDLLHQPAGVLRDIDDTLGREPDPARLEEWHALLRASTLTPSGMRRLAERLRLPPS
jgi:very-short-patch-repair endonuclease